MTQFNIEIKNNENNEQAVSARELYEALDVSKSYRFSQWFDTNAKQLIENEDFTSVDATTVVHNGAVKAIQDYSLTVDAAKQIAMMSGTEKGKEVRMYFIEVEKQFNSPEMMMARSLQYANQKMLQYDQHIKQLNATIEKQAPKVEFADAIQASQDTISISSLATLITQNGYKIGRNILFDYLRQEGYLIRFGEDYNTPSQKAMTLGLFELKESVYGDHITKKTLVTPKGQQYFIKKFKAVA